MRDSMWNIIAEIVEYYEHLETYIYTWLRNYVKVRNFPNNQSPSQLLYCLIPGHLQIHISAWFATIDSDHRLHHRYLSQELAAVESILRHLPRARSAELENRRLRLYIVYDGSDICHAQRRHRIGDVGRKETMSAHLFSAHLRIPWLDECAAASV